MAIKAPQTAPNFSTGDYHRINSIEYHCYPYEPDHPDPPEPKLVIRVGLYANRAARELNPKNPMWTNVAEIPQSQLPQDLRDMVYTLLMQTPLFAGTNAEPDQPVPNP